MDEEITTKMIPAQFIERFTRIYHHDDALKFLEIQRADVFRINTLKASQEDIISEINSQGINFRRVPWFNAAIVPDKKYEGLGVFVEKGLLYKQNLSSMIVPIVLDPRPGEAVLDLCAAPGSKASQMAAMMGNQGELTCVEAVRGRFFKLKNIVKLTGALNITCRLMDGRRYQGNGNLFDKILVDAPCSSEGRFQNNDPETYRYWSLRKIKEMEKKQKGLLLNAFRQLKTGGTLVYSTCTFAPEENEGVINWLLKKKKSELEILKISLPDGVKTQGPVLHWGKKPYDTEVEKCVRILPDETMEGFFITKLRKL